MIEKLKWLKRAGVNIPLLLTSAKAPERKVFKFSATWSEKELSDSTDFQQGASDILLIGWTGEVNNCEREFNGVVAACEDV